MPIMTNIESCDPAARQLAFGSMKPIGQNGRSLNGK
jgi:hypothetical protein